MSKLAGRTLGDYRVVEPLGRGGMAAVYRGEHLSSGAQVAIKTVKAPDERVVRSIRREIRALARLRHPGIVRIVADGLSNGVPWYAMELIEGITLGALCDEPLAHRTTQPGASEMPGGTRTLVGAVEREPIEPASPAPALGVERVLALGRALCDSLAYLHGEGLVHHDLKPDNVVLRGDRDPVIVDFGLAAELRGPTSREPLDVRAGLAGTAAYLAPEVIRGDNVDARADLYALGCILYELLTGTRPFAAFTVVALLRAHLEQEAPPPSERAAGVPPQLDELVMKLLAKDPRERLGHAADVAGVLETLGADPPKHRGPEPREYLYRPVFVGRRDMMEALGAELRRPGTRSLVLIGGESGIGKTRLVNELGAHAARAGFTVLDGECTSAGARPLQAWLNPLQRLGDRCRERGPEEVARIFGARARVLAPYEASLATLPGIEHVDEPAPLSADAARLRLFRSVAETLDALAADGPLLIILDDLQWADGLTLDLLQYLVREPREERPLLIVGTYRSEEVHPGLEPLFSLERARRVAIGRLSDRDVNEMVSDMLAYRAPSSLSDYVARQAEGNPFFVAEYLRAAVEEGLLRRNRTGGWEPEPRFVGRSPAELHLPLPGALRQLVQRRLEGLSTEASALLAMTAVLGRELDVGTLVEASGRSEADAFDAIDELVRRQVLEETGEGRIRFVHDKLREVAYDAIDETALRALHLIAAETLEAREAADPPYDALAHHWGMAGATAKMLDALDFAGQQAGDRGAYKQAADCYRRALEACLPDDRRRADWERRLAEAVLGLGDYAEGRRRIVRALDHHGLPAMRPLPRLALGLGGQIARQIGHRLAPDRFLEGADESGDLLRATRAYQRLGETFWFDNDVPRLADAALRALNLAERAGPSRELARAYATMCLASGSIPIHRLAEHYARLGVATAERVGDPAALAYTLFLNSVYRVGAAKWREVDADLQRAADICLRIGDARFHGESLTVLGMAALYRGDFKQAAELFEEVADSGARTDNLQHRVWAALGLAESRFRTGDRRRARVQLDAALSLLSGAPQTAELLRAHGLSASMHLEGGDLETAIAAAERAQRHIDELTQPTAHYLLEGYAGVAAVRLARLGASGTDGAERAAAKAVRALRIFAASFPIGRPRAATLRAGLLWLAGKRAAAARAWRRARSHAEELGMRYETVLAHESEARHRSGSVYHRIP